MKLTIRERTIHSIPTLEIIQEELSNQPLPLVIFYHGWRNNKELMLTQGRRLANQGFRVILPDSMNHGERRFTEISTIPGVTFLSSIQYNIIEFNLLINYFQERNWILDERIGVGGYSMGGMTTAALLAQHPEIKVAASIMGTPKPSDYIQLIQEKSRAMGRYVPTDLRRILSWVPLFDLSLQPEKLAGRPVLFWHGTLDEKIPYEDTFSFYQANKEQDYAKETVFLTGEGEGHLVTIQLMDQITDFFVEHL